MASWQISSVAKMSEVKKMFRAKIPGTYVGDVTVLPLKSIVSSNDSPSEGERENDA